MPSIESKDELCKACQKILHADEAWKLDYPPKTGSAARAPSLIRILTSHSHHMTESNMQAAAQGGYRICSALWGPWSTKRHTFSQDDLQIIEHLSWPREKVRYKLGDIINMSRPSGVYPAWGFSRYELEGTLDEGYRLRFHLPSLGNTDTPMHHDLVPVNSQCPSPCSVLFVQRF